ncbi:hypothetical protein [Robbsia sp. KACC 23696]|uniref:hypothetical protein n=1 Tax=Robbsia sp. KACC 23696 TaxID=3149231 RepID=UPI00325AFF74
MTPRQPQCIISVWDDEEKAVVSYGVDATKVRSLIASAMPFDMRLDEHDHVVDDEFARILGGRIMKFLAVTNPDIKPFDKITLHPNAP